MSALELLLAASGGVLPPPTVGGAQPDPDAALPYVMPAARPYSAPQPILSDLAPPITAAAGSAMHPSVHDFGPGQTWNGYRYWMGTTPYTGGEAYENPCILASNDCYNWETPVGLTNPIDPAPGGVNYNSDTHIAYDPDQDRLYLWWREAQPETADVLWWSSSSDGITWSAHQSQTFAWVQAISPTVYRVGPGDWRLWFWSPFRMLTAASPEGPWVPLASMTVTGGATGWHGDICRLPNGRWLGLTSPKSGLAIQAMSSADGRAWTVDPTPIITPSAPSGSWDSEQLYRAALRPTADGLDVRVWYSAQAGGFWRTGYVRIPISEWPTP